MAYYRILFVKVIMIESGILNENTHISQKGNLILLNVLSIKKKHTSE